MLFGSNSSSAPRSEASRALRARWRRSARSRVKSTRCSQSTPIVAPRDAMFMRSAPGGSLFSEHKHFPEGLQAAGQRVVVGHVGEAVERAPADARRLAGARAPLRELLHGG